MIGQQSLVAADAVVTARRAFPERALILGSCAKVVRLLSDDEIARVRKNILICEIHRITKYRGSIVSDRLIGGPTERGIDARGESMAGVAPRKSGHSGIASDASPAFH